MIATPAMAVDGTVDFTFTAYRGPYANGILKGPGPTDGLSGVSRVNDVVPTYTGFVGISDTGTSPLHAVALGNAPITGSSATFSLPNTLTSFGLSPIANVVSFSTNNFSGITAGQDFSLGTLTFTNGDWWGASTDARYNTPSYLDFQITTHSSEAAFNQTINGTFVVTSQSAITSVSQCNSSKYDAERDTISLQSSALVSDQSGALGVYDAFCKPAAATNTGSIDLIGHFGSLDLVGFANPGGDGILIGGTDTGPGTPTSSVPEPATWALMIIGFGAVGGTMRRRARRTVSVSFT